MITEQLAQFGAPDLLAPLFQSELFDPTAVGPQVLGEREATDLVVLCQNNRLAPILADAVHAGRVLLAETAIPDLWRAVEHYLASQVRVECQGMAVVDLLIGEGVDFRILKGLATGYLDYPNPALRPVGDLDLLIRPRDMPAVLNLMNNLEEGKLHEPPRNDWRVTHALPFRICGIEIDIHHRLLHQAAGHCAARLDLFADPAEYEIAGRTVFALPPWLRLIQAASQNVLGGSQQVSSDLDVVRLAKHIDNALERAQEVGLGWVVAEGVSRSQANLGWGPMVNMGVRRTWRDRSFEKLYGSERSSVLQRSGFELANAPLLIGLAIIRSALQPGDEYLGRRGRTAWQQLVRQVGRVRG